jgi:hypothetical protein
VNPKIELKDIEEDIEGTYEDKQFGGFKVVNDLEN